LSINKYVFAWAKISLDLKVLCGKKCKKLSLSRFIEIKAKTEIPGHACMRALSE
jgi:hypothetical protein